MHFYGFETYLGAFDVFRERNFASIATMAIRAVTSRVRVTLYFSPFEILFYLPA